MYVLWIPSNEQKQFSFKKLFLARTVLFWCFFSFQRFCFISKASGVSIFEIFSVYIFSFFSRMIILVHFLFFTFFVGRLILWRIGVYDNRKSVRYLTQFIFEKYISWSNPDLWVAFTYWWVIFFLCSEYCAMVYQICISNYIFVVLFSFFHWTFVFIVYYFIACFEMFVVCRDLNNSCICASISSFSLLLLYFVNKNKRFKLQQTFAVLS